MGLQSSRNPQPKQSGSVAPREGTNTHQGGFTQKKPSSGDAAR